MPNIQESKSSGNSNLLFQMVLTALIFSWVATSLFYWVQPKLQIHELNKYCCHFKALSFQLVCHIVRTIEHFNSQHHTHTNTQSHPDVLTLIISVLNLQFNLERPWCAAVHGVAKSWTQLVTELNWVSNYYWEELPTHEHSVHVFIFWAF